MYQYQCRHLYFDKFFPSIKLLRDLEERQTYICLCDRSIEQSRIDTCYEAVRPFAERFQHQASVGEPGGGSVASPALRQDREH